MVQSSWLKSHLAKPPSHILAWGQIYQILVWGKYLKAKDQILGGGSLLFFFSFQYICLFEAFDVELLDICTTIFSSSDSSAVWTRADCLLQIIEIEKWIIEWWVLTHSGSCHLQVYFQASNHWPYGHFSNTKISCFI